jgi:hypothetical protein
MSLANTGSSSIILNNLLTTGAFEMQIAQVVLKTSMRTSFAESCDMVKGADFSNPRYFWSALDKGLGSVIAGIVIPTLIASLLGFA